MNFIQMKEGLSSTADHAKSRYRVKNRKRNGYNITFCIKYAILIQKNNLKRYEEYRRSLKITIFGSLLILFRDNSNCY